MTPKILTEPRYQREDILAVANISRGRFDDWMVKRLFSPCNAVSRGGSQQRLSYCVADIVHLKALDILFKDPRPQRSNIVDLLIRNNVLKLAMEAMFDAKSARQAEVWVFPESSNPWRWPRNDIAGLFAVLRQHRISLVSIFDPTAHIEAVLASVEIGMADWMESERVDR